MSYGIKYRIAYLRFSGGRTTIDVLEKDHVDYTPITNLKAAENPLEVSFEGGIDNIYKPTIGHGVTIKVMVTPLTMFNLFTNDPQKFKVQIWNGVSGSTLIWQGFVNTEIFTENYSTPLSLKGEITINCNDGMTVLDNISYKIGEQMAYTGFVPVAEVLFSIFSKLNIAFTTIRTSFNLLVDLFANLTVNNENYYDEEGEAMSCREVLESIFGGLGLVLSFKGNTIYLIDPINLHDKTLGKEYTLTNTPAFCAGEAPVDVGGFLDVSISANPKIDWYETGQILDIVRQFNQLEVKYDPYNYTEYIYDFNDENNWTLPGSFLAEHLGAGTVTTNGTITLVGDGTSFLSYKIGDSIMVDGETSRIIATISTDTSLTVDTAFLTSEATLAYRIGSYFLNSTVTFKNWVDAVGFSHFAAVKETVDSDPEYFIALFDSDGVITLTIPIINIKQDANLKLKLSMDVWVQTKENNVNIFAEEDPNEGVNINQIRIPISFMIGNQYYRGWDFWGTEEVGFWRYPFLVQKKVMTDAELNVESADTKINNCWTTASMEIPFGASGSIVPYLINGYITIKILDTIRQWMVNQVHPDTYNGNVYYVLLKNIKIEFVDVVTGKSISNDGVSTKANIVNITDRKKSPLNIELTNGTGTFGISRGAFSSNAIYPPGTNITGLARSDDNPSVLTKTSDLVAQNLLSQYNKQRFKMTGKLNVKDYLLDVNMKLIQDSLHLIDKSFYIVNGTYHDREEYMDVEMIELESVRETISALSPGQDWYLASKDEVAAMHTNLYLNGLGNFNILGAENYYWSSSENNATTAWGQLFNGAGTQSALLKYGVFSVRPIRSFISATIYELGDIGPSNGWIFNIVDNGNSTYTYLEAAPFDGRWIGWSNIIDVAVTGTGTAIGTGLANTDKIVAQAGHYTSAAKDCKDLIL